MSRMARMSFRSAAASQVEPAQVTDDVIRAVYPHTAASTSPLLPVRSRAAVRLLLTGADG